MPTVLAAVWLASDASGTLPARLHGAVAFIPTAPLILVAALGLLVVSMRLDRPHLRLGALLLPCAAAPLALLYPWTATPGLPPGGFGGLPYFLGWLTRYPDFGPVNIAVLLGLLCVLGAGLLPALTAVLTLTHAPPWQIRLTAMAALVAYLPVLVRLDVALSLLAVRLVEDHRIVPYATYGPAIRLMAVAAALALAVAVARTPKTVEGGAA